MNDTSCPWLDLCQGNPEECPGVSECPQGQTAPTEFDRLIVEHCIEVTRRQEEWKRLHTPVIVEKTGRNDPCPCGSGKKYKKCCGGI